MRTLLVPGTLLAALLLAAVPTRAQQQLPPPCQAIDESISAVSVFNPGEPDGHQLLLMQLYNSGKTCSLSGEPLLEFADTPHRLSDSSLARNYDPKRIPVVINNSLSEHFFPGPVVLKHTESAQFTITWESVPGASHHKHPKPCPTLDAIRLVLPDDATPVELISLHTRVCGNLNITPFKWGWARQTTYLRPSWKPDAGPNDEVEFLTSRGKPWGDRFNGIVTRLESEKETYSLGEDIVLTSRVRNISSPLTFVVGEHPYRWLSMRESNGHTVLCYLGTAPPSEAGTGTPVEHNSGAKLPDLDLAELDMLPTIIGHVTYALSADFWPARTNKNGDPDPDALAYAPTAVVSYRLTLNFTANN
ncbi:MAG: DUF4232 domain-containing protein [Acidobacteriaceae bacterium]|nr:DUF4232 domain-containing protein [Acidobacteriaceae bacterium]